MSARLNILGHVLLMLVAAVGGYVLLSTYAFRPVFPKVATPIYPLVGMALGFFFIGTCLAIGISFALLHDATVRKNPLRDRTDAEMVNLIACPQYFTVGFALLCGQLLLTR
jgi:hypothetical protein